MVATASPAAATTLVRLSLLDGYGVRWDRATFARDLLQNFFDSATDFASVEVDRRPAEGVIELRGMAEFDLELLCYVGATTKTDGRTAGGFGEGFKVCALVGLRDFGLGVVAGSAGRSLEAVFEPVPLGRELCYRLRDEPSRPRGSWVRLTGCDAALFEAFEAARGYFRHDGNLKLGRVVATTSDGSAAFLESTLRSDGELYYRRQLRGSVWYSLREGSRPLSIAHDGVVEELEGDRDRRELPAGKLAAAVASKLPPEEVWKALIALRGSWEYGHEVLLAIIEAAAARKLRFEFPGWFARARDASGLDGLAKRRGHRDAVGAFASIGMPVARELFSGDLETRAPRPLERAQIDVCRRLYEALHGEAPATKAMEVFDGPAAIQGQHLGKSVVVGADVLAAGFVPAAGTLLHEFAHEAGGEESSRFHARLTKLMRAAVRSPDAVRAARDAYAAAVPAPEPEPEEPPQESDLVADRRRRVLCHLLAPRGMPLGELGKRLAAAAARCGAHPRVVRVNVESERHAVSWLAPGVPTILVGGQDVAPSDAAPGLRVRSFDGRLTPSDDALFAAFDAVMASGNDRGQQSDRIGARRDDGQLLARNRGLVPAEELEQERRTELRADLGLRLSDYAGDGGFDLAGMWSSALKLAGERVIDALSDDALAPGVEARDAWARVRERLDAALNESRRLRREDTTFDDGDAFESDAMASAQGAAVLAWTGAADDARSAAAKRAFDSVRVATTRVLDADLEPDLKELVLSCALAEGGLSYLARDPRWPFDVVAFEAALASGLRVARDAQRERDAGELVSAYVAQRRMERAPDWPSRPERPAPAAPETDRTDEDARAVWDAAFAATGSELAAAEALLEHWRRQEGAAT